MGLGKGGEPAVCMCSGVGRLVLYSLGRHSKNERSCSLSEITLVTTSYVHPGVVASLLSILPSLT
jgi:hypothetical protein